MKRQSTERSGRVLFFKSDVLGDGNQPRPSRGRELGGSQVNAEVHTGKRTGGRRHSRLGRRAFLLFFILALAAFALVPAVASAAITHVGGQSASGSSISLPSGWQAGDLALVFAYRDASATVPTPPGTFTSVTSASGGFISGYRAAVLAYRYLQAGDGSFAFNNATDVQVMVLRGTAPSSPVGSSNSNDATSGTLSYNSLSGLAATSWVVGFGGNTSGPISGYTAADMTLSSSGPDPQLGQHYRTGVTSFSTTNWSGSATGAWATIDAEVRADVPMITINQAVAQADPTATGPIDFSVVFSKPVSDFATGDVTVGGTAGGAKIATVTGSGTTYNVAVSGMTTPGTVIASIAADVAHDLDGNPSSASTSTDNTVTYSPGGPFYAGAGANDNSAGTTPWTNPGNIAANDSAYAVATNVAASSTSQYLNASNFGFSIPTGATINGITVVVDRMGSSTSSGGIRDLSVQLLKGGARIGNDKANTTTNWPTTGATATYGTTSDLWGAGWTASDINASDFGVSLRVSNANTTSARTASVDYVRITVTYTRDTTAPSSSITAPASSAVFTGTSTTITGTASDVASGVADVSVTIQRSSDDLYWTGLVWQPTAYYLPASYAAGSWSYDWTFDPVRQQGSPAYTIQATATDNAGNSAGSAAVTGVNVRNQFTLTYAPGAGGSLTGEAPQTVDYGSDGTAVTALPDQHYSFVGWSDGVLTASRTDLNVTGDVTVTALFAIDTNTVTATAGAHGAIDPAGAVAVDYDADQAFTDQPRPRLPHRRRAGRRRLRRRRDRLGRLHVRERHRPAHDRGQLRHQQLHPDLRRRRPR